jgi:hypothetical protein
MTDPTRKTSTAVALPRPLVDVVVVADGIFAGAFAAGFFALYFLAFDLIRSEALATPSLVGAVILQGASPQDAVPVKLGLVAAYSLVHAVLFAGFGVAASVVTNRLSRLPDLPLLALGCFLALEGGFLIGTAIFAPGLGAAIGHGVVLAGNAVASVVFAIYLRSARNQ